jgi:pimeloyl-ACP methyl ester carboxylesterase
VRCEVDHPADLGLRVIAVFADRYYQSTDGLWLYARDYQGPAGRGMTPVLCLAGLTRNSKDFEALAPHLAASRRVICPDYRGRGRSQYGNPKSYRPDVELGDALRLLDELNVRRVAVIGTSRGGLIGMVMAAGAKDRLAGLAFNDIGPAIDAAGLIRIRNYIGPSQALPSWEAAVAALKATNPGFRGLSEAQWLAFARRVFRNEAGLPRPDYDMALAETFPSAEAIASGKLGDSWPLFDAIGPLPALVLHGENSDLLSAATVAEMQARHAGLAAVTVKDRAHVPFLDEPEALAAIENWLAAVDAAETAR